MSSREEILKRLEDFIIEYSQYPDYVLKVKDLILFLSSLFFLIKDEEQKLKIETETKATEKRCMVYIYKKENEKLKNFILKIPEMLEDNNYLDIAQEAKELLEDNNYLDVK